MQDAPARTLEERAANPAAAAATHADPVAPDPGTAQPIAATLAPPGSARSALRPGGPVKAAPAKATRARPVAPVAVPAAVAAVAEAAARTVGAETVRVADKVQSDAYEAIDRAETAFSQGPAIPFSSPFSPPFSSPFAPPSNAFGSLDPFALMPPALRRASETAARSLSDVLNAAHRTTRTATEAVEERFEATSALTARRRTRALGLARDQVSAGHDLMRAVVSATTPAALIDAQQRFAATQARIVSQAAAEMVVEMRGFLQR